ncbi:MAG: tyrosine-type recombinase/integrase [Sporolactobacillus sp.]
MIEEFLQSKQMRHKSLNTLKNYKRDLILFYGYISKYHVTLDGLNDLIVQQYIKYLENKYSPATINRMYASIRSFCHYSNQLEAVEDIEIQRVLPISKQPSKGLDEAGVTNLRLRIANDKLSRERLRNQAICDFLLYTGCRVSEMVAVNCKDVTYTNGVYTIHFNKSKNDLAKDGYIEAKNYKYIKRYLDSREDDNEALFLSTRGRISVRMVETMLKKYGVHPHLLRHTFCLRLRQQGIDLATIATLAGHKDINVTRRYSNPSEKELAQAVTKAFSF